MEKTEKLKKAIEKTWLASNGVIEAINLLNEAGLDNHLRTLYYLGEEQYHSGDKLGTKYCLYLITKQATYTSRQSYGFFSYNLTTKHLKGCVCSTSVYNSNENHDTFMRFKDLFYGLVTSRESRNEENSKEILELIRSLFNPDKDNDNNFIIDTYLYHNNPYNPKTGNGVMIMEEPIKGCIDPREFLPSGDVVLKSANHDFTRDIMVEHPKHGGYESHYMPVYYRPYTNVLYVADTVGGAFVKLPLFDSNKEEYETVHLRETLKYSIVNDEIKLDALSWYQDGKDARGSNVSLEVLSIDMIKEKEVQKCVNQFKFSPIKGFFMFRIDNSLGESLPFEEVILLSFDMDYFTSTSQDEEEGDLLTNVLKYLTKANNNNFITGFGHSPVRGKYISDKTKYTFKEGMDTYKQALARVMSRLSSEGIEIKRKGEKNEEK